MIAITDKNVTKLSEDHLYERQDALYNKGQISSIEYQLCEAELDRRNNIRLYNEKKKKLAELARIEEIDKLKAEYENIKSSNGTRVTMKAMVAEFGGDYEDDYSISDDFTVHSACFNPRNPNQEKTFLHSSLKEALHHVHLLKYYRVYHRYLRDVKRPEPQFLVRLHAAIIGILKGE